MGCQRASGNLAPPVVNNFAANRAPTASDWPLGFIPLLVLSGFPARAGQMN
jgi:hypothetical protein